MIKSLNRKVLRGYAKIFYKYNCIRFTLPIRSHEFRWVKFKISSDMILKNTFMHVTHVCQVSSE